MVSLFSLAGQGYNKHMKQETIVFGGGCFWCTEAVFNMLRGVISVEPGYAGGDTPNPTYEQISGGDTGHAEVIKIDYDADVVPLETLLTIFFASHDPTTLNRQGNDVGTQYRSVVLCDNEAQIIVCKKFIEELNTSATAGAPIITEVTMLEKFYPAEDYHKNYYENNKQQGYCQVVINPKLKKVQEKFLNLLKKQ